MIAEADLWEAREDIEEFLDATGRPLSGYSFANIFLWKDFFSYGLEMIEGCLCLMAESDGGVFLYLPPLGREVSPRVLAAGLMRLKAMAPLSSAGRIENVPRGMLACCNGGEFRIYKRGYEFVYYRRDVAGLRGNAFKSRRGDYNVFARQEDIAYAVFDGGRKEECLALYDRWADVKRQRIADPVFRAMLDENRRVHELAMTSCRELGLEGRTVSVGGDIRAYTFGFPLNSTTFCVLFEIADPSLKGAATFIFREFCDDPVLRDFCFINAMDDFAMPAVSRAKLSFCPTHLEPVYAVSRVDS